MTTHRSTQTTDTGARTGLTGVIRRVARKVSAVALPSEVGMTVPYRDGPR